MNLPPFYVGQRVVFLGSTGNGLVKGETYKVEYCVKRCCAGWVVSVGVDCPTNKDVMCPDCDKTYPGPRLELCAYLYRPAQQQSFPLITLEKIKEKEKEEILCSN